MKLGSNISSEKLKSIEELSASSTSLIRGLQDRSGAYPASPTFSAYEGFSWFRDGAFIADGMSSAGAFDSSEKFFAWCANTIEPSGQIIQQHYDLHFSGEAFDPANALPTRYAFDQVEDPDEPWPDHQIDGYGSWIWALEQHSLRSGMNAAPFSHAVSLSIKYLLASWSSPCYDWWEENSDKVHVATLGSVASGMRSAINLNLLDENLTHQADIAIAEIESKLRRIGSIGHLPKWEGSPQVDASALSLLAPLGVIDKSDPIYLGTIKRIRKDLLQGYGVHRYDSDSFFGGGLWPLLSCYLALAELRIGNRKFAEETLIWVSSLADRDSHLPEQVNSHLIKPRFEEYWLNRWGPSARPLLWTHAMFLKLKSELERTK